MPIQLYRRPNGIWRLRGTVQGVRIDRSARTRVKSEAAALRAKIERELFKEAVYGKRSVATFADAVEAYLDAGGASDYLLPLVDQLGELRLSQVNQAIVDKLAQGRPVKASTLIRQIYTPVSAVINHAASQGLCDPIRLRKPKVRTTRTEWLRPSEAESLLESLPPHLRRLVTFYLGTGCRASEALALEPQDISGDRAVFWETKGGYSRSVRLSDRVLAELEVPFLNSRGQRWHGYDAVNLALRKIAPVHCHMFRHTWATWNYAVHRDLTRLMSEGGWRSVTMVMRYTHAGSDALKEEVLRHGWGSFGAVSSGGEITS